MTTLRAARYEPDMYFPVSVDLKEYVFSPSTRSASTWQPAADLSVSLQDTDSSVLARRYIPCGPRMDILDPDFIETEMLDGEI